MCLSVSQKQVEGLDKAILPCYNKLKAYFDTYERQFEKFAVSSFELFRKFR